VNSRGAEAVEDRYLAATYSKMPITVVKGRGALLWDIEGREYIDCMGGYGAALVGHCNPRVVEAVKKQAERLITCHSSLYNDRRAELLERLIKIAPKGLDRVFLCNSGAESVEAAIKIARRYTGRAGIVAMTGGFHGKTIGALSTTWSPRYREPFQPLLPDVSFTPFGDSEKIRDYVSDKTAAVIVEPIQGETGVRLPPEGFLKELREACDMVGSLLIFDEVQTGFGRTGRMWASQHWGVTPDIICLSKSMAGGLPIGATLARDEVMSAMKVGDHSTTFGGNPLSCAAAIATIDYIVEEGLPRRAERLGGFFKDGLIHLMEDHRGLAREVRGLGLMLALELRFDVHNILMNGLKENLILLYSGRNTLRFLPPLVITEEQLERVLIILERLLEAEDKLRSVK